jgi:flagellar export protein FliJ
MRAFEFRLEKVLRWRQAQLELEQFALSRLAAERVRWKTALANLDAARDAAEQAVISSQSIGGADLGALAKYRQRLQNEKELSSERLRQCEHNMTKQRERLLEARRGYRLLEKLRHARRVEWETAVDREFESLADEAFLAQWAPPRRDSAR